jgi:hypothetical protein
MCLSKLLIKVCWGLSLNSLHKFIYPFKLVFLYKNRRKLRRLHLMREWVFTEASGIMKGKPEAVHGMFLVA